MKFTDSKSEIEKDPEYQEGLAQQKLKFALGDAIIDFRIRQNISQSELARRVGTKQANISRIESALANPTIELVQRILRVLDLEAQFLPPAELITYDQETPEFNSIKAANWPVDITEPSKSHMVAERRNKHK